MEHYYHKAAWFPPILKIGGVRVAPPTLGQWRILELMESPFVRGGKAAAKDVRSALLVFKTPWRRCRRAIMRHPKLFAWYAFVRFWRVTPIHCVEISAWLNEVWKHPEQYISDDAKPSQRFSPCSSSTVILALSLTRMRLPLITIDTVASVWDLSVPEALLLIVADAERRGAEFEEPQNSL